MIPVVLSSREMAEGRSLGMERVRRSVERGELPQFPYTGEESAARQHILGARGEAAFCKALGLDWVMSVDNFADDWIPGGVVPGIDQPPFWQVRTSPNPNRVKVTPRDHPEAMVVHVQGDHGSPQFRVHGYIMAGWAQARVPALDEGGRGRPAHFVPIAKIVPMDPDWHAACRWGNAVDGVWRCSVCGAVWHGN